MTFQVSISKKLHYSKTLTVTDNDSFSTLVQTSLILGDIFTFIQRVDFHKTPTSFRLATKSGGEFICSRNCFEGEFLKLLKFPCNIFYRNETFVIAPVLRGIFSHIYKESISNSATFNSFRLSTRGKNFLVLTFLATLYPSGSSISGWDLKIYT